jgi:recombination protein RecA
MSKGASLADLSAEFKKAYGKEVGGLNPKLVDRPRIPTGIYELDYALGGGVPRGCVLEVFGPESSCKTNIILKLIASHQRLWPDEKCVFFDIEGTFDPKWAEVMGVNVKALYVFKPLYAEQSADMVQKALGAEDCGFVAIDSIAALATAGEIENSAEKSAVGGNSYVVSRLIKKITVALAAAHMDGRVPTVAFVNQTRFKIGVMFQDPETTPGGNAPRFAATMRLRTYAKNIKDTKISDTMPVRKKISVIVKKWKVPIISASTEFEIAMIPHNGLKVGQSADWPTIDKHLRMHGLLEKGPKGGWVMAGATYPTLDACKEKFYSDTGFGDLVRKAIIEKGLEEVTTDSSKAPKPDPEEDVASEGEDA